MRHRIDQASSEQGSILLEALVSGILLVITAVGVFNAFEAGSRASAEERHRAQAEGLAQADLARLRTMRISALVNLHQTKTVTIEKTPYTVDSVASFQEDANSTASCKSGEARADYIEIRSTVSWPSLGSRKPVVEESLVAPPNGSVSAKSGTLVVQIENADSGGVKGVGLNGSGAGTFAGVTGESGCAIFGDLPAGNYTLTLSGGALVDKNGEAPKAQATSVVAESTNTLVLQYDFGGTVQANFETHVGGELVPSSAASIVAYNSGMLVPKIFGSPGEPQATVAATPLFPFASTYSVYAGACKEDNPGAGAPEGAVGEAIVTPKGTTPVTIVLPSLNLTAWEGTEAAPGEPVAGARVTATDMKCGSESEKGTTYPMQAYITDAKGHLPDPGLPYSTYDVCVSDEARHVSVNGLEVPAQGSGEEAEPEEEADPETTLSVFLGASGAEAGECP